MRVGGGDDLGVLQLTLEHEQAPTLRLDQALGPFVGDLELLDAPPRRAAVSFETTDLTFDDVQLFVESVVDDIVGQGGTDAALQARRAGPLE
jgi:hypothetical protein